MVLVSLKKIPLIFTLNFLPVADLGVGGPGESPVK